MLKAPFRTDGIYIVNVTSELGGHNKSNLFDKLGKFMGEDDNRFEIIRFFEIFEHSKYFNKDRMEYYAEISRVSAGDLIKWADGHFSSPFDSLHKPNVEFDDFRFSVNHVNHKFNGHRYDLMQTGKNDILKVTVSWNNSGDNYNEYYRFIPGKWR